MFSFSGKVQTAYARNIVEWSTKFGQRFCSTFNEHCGHAEHEIFLAFVFVLAEKIHATFSKDQSPSNFKRAIPTKIQSTYYRQHGAEIPYARLVLVFDRKRILLDRHLTGFLEAHRNGVHSALKTHVIRIASVLFQQSFGRVVPNLAPHLENLTSLFISIVDDAKALTLKH